MSAAQAEMGRRLTTGRIFVGLVVAACVLIQGIGVLIELTERDPYFGLRNNMTIRPADFTKKGAALGLRVGDTVLALNRQPLTTPHQYEETLRQLQIGTQAVLTVQRAGDIMDVAIPISFPAPRPDWLARNLVGACFLAVGMIVGWQRADHRDARLFFLATGCVGLYLALVLVNQTPLVYLQALVLGLAPAFTLHLFLEFPKSRLLARAHWRWAIYVLSAILVAAIGVAVTKAVLVNGAVYNNAVYNFWINVTFGYLALAAVFGLVRLLYQYQATHDSILRRQVQWIIWGLAFGIAAACLDMALTALNMQTAAAAALVQLVVLPVPIALGMAVLHYRLLDVTWVIKRSVVYALLTAGLVAIYLLLVSAISTLLGLAASSPYRALVMFISAFAIGLLVTPVRSRIQALLDRMFFRRDVDYQRALSEWSEKLSVSLLFTDLTRLLVVDVPERMAIERAWLLALNREGTRLDALAEPGRLTAPEAEPQRGLELMTHSPFATRLASPAMVLVLEGEQGASNSTMAADAPTGWRRADVHVVMPLVSGGQLLGVYLLGAKRSGDLYQRQELDLLRTLANQAAVTMANARLYEQVRASSHELEKQVEDRTRELRDSLSTVYHELRTPITAIQGYSEMMVNQRAGPLTERQQRFMDSIRSNVRRLADLVTDLSEVSLIETGRMQVFPEPMDIRAAAEETVAALIGRIEEKELKVSLGVAPGEAVVNGDYKRVVQILTNLIGNACQYTPAGGEISVACRQMNGTVETTVSDTGIGIQADEMKHIFERFYRGEDPIVRDQRGTGLGLPICKSLVELQGGGLWAKSEYGRGSVFGFTLPAAPSDAGTEPRAPGMGST